MPPPWAADINHWAVDALFELNQTETVNGSVESAGTNQLLALSVPSSLIASSFPSKIPALLALL